MKKDQLLRKDQLEQKLRRVTSWSWNDKAAGALSIDDVISSDITISRNIYQQRASTSSWYLKLAIAKRCRLHKLIRQRFAFALKIQQMVCDDKTSSAIAYPVGMVSRRKKSRSREAWQPGAMYPVDKETAVARSVVTKNKQQLSEQLLNNLLENIQPFNAINAQDGRING
ncbi:hypothetical protein F511_22835 [Dorcoceras hygrometricum]|uniref:Uncharacterized protein n=1 Tax=Dorcoceras hygrometricum TaxID=472368 RepID=A0A2Z7BV87_9LAMI|nr:hypothetical protein F511_22835 [Dorcoceras hygrometricum]